LRAVDEAAADAIADALVPFLRAEQRDLAVPPAALKRPAGASEPEDPRQPKRKPADTVRGPATPALVSCPDMCH